MALYVYEFEYAPAHKIFSAFADEDYALLLDSADTSHPDARYSFIALHPFEVLTFDADKDKGNPFTRVQERLTNSHLSTETRKDLPPFQGGAAGLFGYDLGRTLEKLPSIAARDEDIPDMAIGLYDQIISFDHTQQKSWILIHADSKDEAEKKYTSLRATAKQSRSCANNSGLPRRHEASITFDAQTEEHAYTRQICRIIDYIRAGDIFQANMTQRFEAKMPEDFNAYAHYLHLREMNAAPFAGYFKTSSAIISSASPERFLLCSADGRVETKPIKGTRPRIPDAMLDNAIQDSLLNSEKDRAENTMIVDLLRNDLSKTCTADSIEVEKLCVIESFASVHHLVSTISAQLREDKTSLDLLEGCFPGGSITGAPKIRAMEIIEELEPTRRGPYCGALGYIGANGAMDTNILIRTLVYHDGKIYMNAGGGIVADSNPQDEYQESLDKTAAIFNSFTSFSQMEPT